MNKVNGMPIYMQDISQVESGVVPHIVKLYNRWLLFLVQMSGNKRVIIKCLYRVKEASWKKRKRWH